MCEQISKPFCDHSASHYSGDTLEELAENEVMVMTYRARLSHLLQMLDLLLFGRSEVMKKYIAKHQLEHREVDDPGSLVDEHDVVGISRKSRFQL
jgi:hypothetical protein